MKPICKSLIIFGSVIFFSLKFLLAQTPLSPFTSAPSGGSHMMSGTCGSGTVTHTIAKPTAGCYGVGFQYGDNRNGFGVFNAGSCPGGSGSYPAANMWSYVSGAGTNTIVFNMATVNAPGNCLETPIPTPTLTFTITSPASGLGSTWSVITSSKYAYVTTNGGNVTFTSEEKAGGQFVNSYEFKGCTQDAFQTCSDIIYGWFQLSEPSANAGAAITTCTGVSPISMSGASASNYGSQSWSGGSGLGSWTQNADPALATFTPSVSAGSFTAVLTANGTGECAGSSAAPSRLIIWGSSGDWIGAVSNDWFNGGNWCSAIPVSTTDVNVPVSVPNMPVINSAGAVSKNITIQSGATLSISTSDTLTIYGDWDNSGTFTSASGRVKFNGTSAQVIKGSSVTTFNNFTINNSSDITLNKPANITGQMILIAGKINTTATNILTLTSTASSTSGKATSFVNGPMVKQGSTDFIFPVGKTNRLAGIGVINLSGSEDFTAEYFNYPYSGSASLNSPLQVVSAKEHWLLSPAGGGQAQVRLYWEDASYSDILNCATDGDLVVAHQTGSVWQSEGSPTVISTCTGSAPSSGWVQSNNISSFSPFTFGSKVWQSNPLLIGLGSINFTCDNSSNASRFNVIIDWVTLEELNSTFFSLERSLDGKEFSRIGTVKAAGNSNIPVSYSFTDRDITSDTTFYYRISLTDINGYTKILNMLPVTCNNNITYDLNIKLFPSPGSNSVSVSIYNPEKNSQGSEIEIIDILSRKIVSKSFQVKCGENLFDFNTESLAPGPYLINMEFEKSRPVSRMFVIK